MSHFLSQMLKRGAGPYSLRDETTGTVVIRHLEAAFDSAARRKGLLGRDSLARDSAIVIAPCNSIHTFFMRFPIDVAFVRRSGEVVKVCHDVRPWRLRMAPRAFAVVEFASGVLQERGVDRGHRLTVLEAPA